MSKIVVCVVFLAACAATAWGQSFAPVPAPTQANLIGTINGSLKIRMTLTRQGNELTGSYYYETRKKPITLRGVAQATGYFEVDEYGAKGAITGHLIGVFTRDHEVLGFWSKDDASTSPKLPLRLVEEGKGTIAAHQFEVLTP